MIKFFRKIRQKLLSDGKFSKYIIYAAGEIILVVIGILIALQINNWNVENQALNEIENNFQNLSEDLVRNKTQLLSLIKIREEAAGGGGFLIDNYESQVQLNENEFINKLYPILSERYFEINRDGIDKVMTSSAFELEELETLRDLIKSYLRSAGVLRTFETKENAAIEHMEMITAGNGYFRTVWKSFRQRRYQSTTQYQNPDFDFLEIMDNDELLYLIFRYEFVTKTALEHYHNLIAQGDAILKAIEDYERSNK